MAILAYKNGDLISVSIVKENPKTTKVVDCDNKEYTYSVYDANRKLFTGVNAVADAIDWVELQNGFTLHGLEDFK